MMGYASFSCSFGSVLFVKNRCGLLFLAVGNRFRRNIWRHGSPEFFGIFFAEKKYTNELIPCAAKLLYSSLIKGSFSLVHLSSVCPQTSPLLHTKKQQNSSQTLLPLISLFYVLWI
ncbi:MAG: hypothetical protein RR826_02455, partial [Christensenellaceae bacterium]